MKSQYIFYFLFLHFSSTSSFAEEAVAYVYSISGNAYITSHEEQKKDLSLNQEVFENDIIETRYSKVTLVSSSQKNQVFSMNEFQVLKIELPKGNFLSNFSELVKQEKVVEGWNKICLITFKESYRDKKTNQNIRNPLDHKLIFNRLSSLGYNPFMINGKVFINYYDCFNKKQIEAIEKKKYLNFHSPKVKDTCFKKLISINFKNFKLVPKLYPILPPP